jgi:hypothetical protein
LGLRLHPLLGVSKVLGGFKLKANRLSRLGWRIRNPVMIPQAKQLVVLQALLSRESYERIQVWLERQQMPSEYVFKQFDSWVICQVA